MLRAHNAFANKGEYQRVSGLVSVIEPALQKKPITGQ